jgi:polysaccharide export outer membrane protein
VLLAKRLTHLAVLIPVLALAALPLLAQGGSTYRVGPKDLVDISVFEEPALNGQYRVSEQGAIRLPLIGNFPVAGLTEAQLVETLKGHLEANYLQRASVTAEIREYLSQPISVIGAIANPGNLDLSGRYTLLQAITAAGGLADNHGNTVFVRRRAENGLSDQIEISLEQLMMGNDPRLDIPIFANDVINIPATVEITIYLLGEVSTQGALAFENTRRVTLLTAISRAGGVTDRASDKIIVRRTHEDGTVTEMSVDYKRIVNGRDIDLELQDGDVIVIKESFF